jgi:UPF0755 protein
VTHSSKVLLRDGLAAGAATLACLLLIGIFCQASHHDGPYVYFVVDRGMSYAGIARRVSLTGLVKDEVVFLLLGRVFGIEHRAKAGRYRVSSTSSMVTILKTLYKGATYRERITIRPGKTVESVGHVLTQLAAVDSIAFLTLAEDSGFVSRLGIPSITAEGYLFPDTYDVEWGESPEVVIKQMVSGFSRAFDDSLTARARRLGMSINEAVTLASIIEKEAMLDSERPRISAVFHNRLRIGMKLQADPTVRYALKKWTGRMLYKDLEVESPFNTYWAHGLPPRPICSPGLPSLIAAVNPQPGSKDLYFVAQGDGSHYFSRSAGEHQRAKARYKQYLRSIETKDDETGGEDQASQEG